MLARLSREPAETDAIACALAANPATPADVAETLAGHESFAVRQLVARRTDLPVETYEQLAADTTRVVRRHLAANSVVPEHLLRALATDEEMRDDLLDNPALPLDLLIVFAAGLTPQLLPRIAAATESELRSLASSALRPLVAVRPDLPSALLDELVADPALAEVVVTNRALTGAQVRQLADRHGPRLHLAAAQHPNCPPDLLHQLARSGSEEVRGAIAVHSASPAEALSLCLGGGVATRRAVARHPNLPPETIVELLAGEETVSEAAANPSLPISVMEDLLSSE